MVRFAAASSRSPSPATAAAAVGKGLGSEGLAGGLAGGLAAGDASPHSLLMHNSEFQAKPMVGNKAIEALEPLEVPHGALPFAPLPLPPPAALSFSDIEAHMTTVYKHLQKLLSGASPSTVSSAALADLQALAALCKYLCCLVSANGGAGGAGHAANVLATSPFTALLLRVLRVSNNFNAATPLRGAAGGAGLLADGRAWGLEVKGLGATLLALTVRYATYIPAPPSAANITPSSSSKHHNNSNSSNSSGGDSILTVLCALLDSSSASASSGNGSGNGGSGRGTSAASAGRPMGGGEGRFRRRLAAALGEMVFYVAAQESDAAADKDSEGLAVWALPPCVAPALCRLLED
eukprot:gene41093-50135_t